FFFQAEDGIRDRNVTGVQTCALPIWLIASGLTIPTEGSVLLTIADKDKLEARHIAKWFHELGFKLYATKGTATSIREIDLPVTRSEERRVGKEQRNREARQRDRYNDK